PAKNSKAAAPAKASKPAPAPAPAPKAKAAPATRAKAPKVSPAPKAASSLKSFGAKFLGQQRAVLVEERSRHMQSAERWTAEADSLMSEREPGDVQFDEESGEGDSLAVERDRDLALSAQARAQVEQIDAAVARLDADAYGICVACGQVIVRERLEAIPWAAECVTCKAGSIYS
ncbi:MAG: hypothetical protein FJW83_05545, partial [Actinobacteria bacterium]|nr:hypothetical protein [Actinomycetota bacterium]